MSVLNVYASDFTLVIDAGHGGKDIGAVGVHAYEKNINLGVALKFGQMVEKDMNDVKVVYTRKNDKFVTLQGRADIANKSNGDLFVSIHTNSVDKNSKNRNTVKGSSTYTLGLHKTESNLDVAKRENSVMVLEPDYTMRYKGFDPNSDESYIMFEFAQKTHMNQSLSFASMVQREFVSRAGRLDKGVRQAGFWVLSRTSMPAVLVELDFICNPTQEEFLDSDDGQNKMAKALYEAFKRYKSGRDSQLKSAGQFKAKKYKGSDKIVAEKDNKNANNSGKTTKFASKDSKKSDIKDKKNDKSDDDKKLKYKIQFLTSINRLSSQSPELKGLKKVSYYQERGVYKYTYGETEDKNEAFSILKEVKQKFKGAFVIGFKGDKRVL